MDNNYLSSVNITTGWFTKAILQSKGTEKPKIEKPPTFLCRYNPMIDTGAGNKVWLKSTLNDHWTPPTTELYLLFENEPLWLCLYGWFDYINDLKPVYNIFEYYTLVIQSKYFQTAYTQKNNIIVPIDESFISGKGPYNSTPTDKDSQKWIPVLKHQQQSINNIVKCGPYIPRPYAPYSNWELHCDYCFFLSGEAQCIQTTQLQIQQPLQNTPYPIHSSKVYKSLIQQNKSHKKCYTVGTTDETSLHQKLLKECMNTYQLNKLYQQMQIPQNPQAKNSEQPKSQNAKKKKQKSSSVSSNSSAKIHQRKKKHIQKKRKYSTSSSSSSSSSSNSSTTS